MEAHNDKGKFRFEKILPGKYMLKINLEDFCWKNEKFDIELSDSDMKDLDFI